MNYNSQLQNLNSNMRYRLAIEQVWHENQEESSLSNKPKNIYIERAVLK